MEVAGRTGDPAAWRAAVTVAAGLAGVAAAYLAFVALVLGVPPAGCGSGSSCGEVLSSSWSKVFGLPVALPALGIYIGILVLARLPPSRVVLSLRALSAGAVAGAVAWFVVLQALVLRAFCVYCMADHLLGLLAAGLLVARGGSRRGRYVAAGVGLAALLAGVQVVQPRPLTHLATPVGGDLDRGAGPSRELAVHGGRLQLRVGDEPRFGPDAAPTAIVLMLDYACPHCRKVHEYCRTLIERGGELLVVALPTPINAKCNAHVRETPARFRESCELARLSAAVFFAAPGAWAAYDAWLFEPETPRTAAEASAKAAELLGRAPGAALADPRVERMVQRNVEAFGAIPATGPADRRVPVTWSPGRPPILGPVESGRAFIEWLNRPAGGGASAGGAEAVPP